MKKINQKSLSKKVTRLVEAMRIPKHKLGELLGDASDQQNVKINRANRFLRGETKRISIEQVEQIAEFFSLPLHYFLTEGETVATLHQDGTGKTTDKVAQKYYESIMKGLHGLGFDETFIALQMEQIQAIKHCRDQKKMNKK